MAVATPAACSLLLLLLLVAPPDSSAAAVGASTKFVGKWLDKAISKFMTNDFFIKWMKDHAIDWVKDHISWHRNKDDQLGGFGALIFTLSVGTSSRPQTLSFVMDITEQLVWARCGKPDLWHRHTQAPTFRPDSSFAPIGCDDTECHSLPPDPDYNCTDPDEHCKYTRDFDHRGAMSGYLATETFNFGTTPVTGMVFGCSHDVTVRGLDGASGFAGFSRGPLSLVSQLQISRFSYFIARPDDNNGNDNSFVSLGDVDAAPAMGNNSTPLLEVTDSDLYYVNLTGIQVEGELLADIQAGTFAVQEDGSVGVFLSTTSPFTFLQDSAYKVLRQELVSRIRSQDVAPVDATADPPCFLTKDLEKATVPTLALVFDGADAAMELDVKNYFFAYSYRHTCLAILPSSTGRSVLGSLLQTGGAGPGVARDNSHSSGLGAPLPAFLAAIIREDAPR